MYEFHSGSAYKVETFPRTKSAYFALVIETFILFASETNPIFLLELLRTQLIIMTSIY